MSERANLDVAQAGERETLVAVNRMVDSLVGPLHMTAEYVDSISKGVIPPKIAENYRGEFGVIKNNLNNCIDQLSALIAEMGRMSEEHNKGDIDVTIPADRFEGAYRAVARGVNEMVAEHIAGKRKAMACVDEFVDMPGSAVYEIADENNVRFFFIGRQDVFCGPKQSPGIGITSPTNQRLSGSSSYKQRMIF